MNEKYHGLKKACKNCPFKKKGAIELMPGRLDGIIEELLSNDYQSFDCHKTVHSKNGGDFEYDEEGNSHYIPSGNEMMCYGAMSYLAKSRRPSVSMRMAAAFGMLDIKKIAQDEDIIDPPNI